MKGVIELRITKTELEKLILYTRAGSFVESIKKGDTGVRTDQLMRMLMTIAEMNGTKNTVIRIDGQLSLTETAVRRMEKAFESYDMYAYEKISAAIKNLSKKVRKK